jgi:hypothetical protein
MEPILMIPNPDEMIISKRITPMVPIILVANFRFFMTLRLP